MKFCRDVTSKDNTNIPAYDKLLTRLRLKSVSYSTVPRWMTYLGYRYYENKQSYYTDGHARDDVVKDRND